VPARLAALAVASRPRVQADPEKPEPPASSQLDVPDPEIRTVQKATCLLIGFSVSADWISISTDSERRPQLVHMIVIKK
jgi:hypothetical protein